MKRSKMKQEYFILTIKEEAAMKVLWGTDKALSASEIADAIPDRSWPTGSMQNIIKSLEKKMAIKVADITLLGKTYGRLFRPTLTANEYATMQFRRYYQKEKNDKFSILSSILDSEDTDKEDLVQTLETLLSKYKGE